jgi:mono/diheme cytochrome c family protein
MEGMRVISAKVTMATKAGLASLGLVLALAPLLAQQAPTAAPAGNVEKGKALFEGSACGTCHTLAAAETVGEIGPALDHNAKLTHELLVARMKDGQGAMPPYAGQLSDAEIEDVATYVLSAAAK